MSVTAAYRWIHQTGRTACCNHRHCYYLTSACKAIHSKVTL